MPSLLEIIQKNANKAAAKPGSPLVSQTEKATSLAAARSGKAVTEPQVVDTTAEDMARAGTAQQFQGLQTATNVQGQEQKQQQSEIARMEQAGRADLNIRQKALNQQLGIRKQQILQELSQGKQKLSLDQKRAATEDLAQALRLEDRKYTDTLEMQGKRQRLDNDIAFKEAAAQAVMADEVDMLKKILGQNEIMGANDRESKEKLAKMDLAAAISLASSSAAAEKQMGMYQGATDLTKTGVSAYGSYKKGEFSEGYQSYKDAGGTGSYSQYKETQPGGSKYVGPV